MMDNELTIEKALTEPISQLEIATQPNASSSDDDIFGVYRWYVAFLLMACYALSMIDRQVLSLLVNNCDAAKNENSRK